MIKIGIDGAFFPKKNCDFHSKNEWKLHVSCALYTGKEFKYTLYIYIYIVKYLHPENKKKKGIYNVFKIIEYTKIYTKALITSSLTPLK